MTAKRTSLPTEDANNQAFRSQITVGAIVAVLLILAVGVIFYINIFKFGDSAKLRQESYLTQLYMERFFSDLKDVETGHRGFILTGRESYLEPYNQALISIDKNWHQLIQHQTASGGKLQKLLHLKELTDTKLAEIKKSLAIYRAEGKTTAINLINFDQGKRVMDKIRVQINEITEEENREVALHNEALQTDTRNTVLFSVALGLLGLFLFLFIIILLARESNTRIRLYNRLELEVLERKRVNEQLELEAAERERVNEQLKLEAAERERAKNQIDELNKTLEAKVNSLDAVNKELEAFSYSVSHDLRAPLRSIDGFSQAFLNKYGETLDDNGRDYLNRVRVNSQRMAQLIDDMLQLSRLTRGEINLSQVNLSQLAEEIIEENRQQEPNRQVEVIIQPELIVEGDKRLLQAVLQNLLNNAWKFTSQHETAKIEFGSFLKDNKPVYFVRDDGAGFEMEYVEKLFGAFQRLHAMHEFPGTGIGLATVQRIIHRHGGKVWAEGEPEKGATFYFTLNTELQD